MSAQAAPALRVCRRDAHLEPSARRPARWASDRSTPGPRTALVRSSGSHWFPRTEECLEPKSYRISNRDRRPAQAQGPHTLAARHRVPALGRQRQARGVADVTSGQVLPAEGIQELRHHPREPGGRSECRRLVPAVHGGVPWFWCAKLGESSQIS